MIVAPKVRSAFPGFCHYRMATLSPYPNLTDRSRGALDAGVRRIDAHQLGVDDAVADQRCAAVAGPLSLAVRQLLGIELHYLYGVDPPCGWPHIPRLCHSVRRTSP